jgi:hypothetical protein
MSRLGKRRGQMRVLNRLNKLIKWTSDGFVREGGTPLTTTNVNEILDIVEEDTDWRFKPSFTLCSSEDESEKENEESSASSNKESASDKESSTEESGSVEPKCTVCKRVFATKYNLKRHEKNFHPYAHHQEQ